MLRRKPRDVWQYGTLHVPTLDKPTIARRHRRTGAVQFVLWKAGEQGHRDDYWHPFDKSNWELFVPNEPEIIKHTKANMTTILTLLFLLACCIYAAHPSLQLHPFKLSFLKWKAGLGCFFMIVGFVLFQLQNYSDGRNQAIKDVLEFLEKEKAKEAEKK